MREDEQHHHGHSSHGNTVAAWTTVAILIFASLVAAVAFPLEAPWLFAVAVGIAVLGLVVGKVLSMSGLGAVPSYTEQSPDDTHLEGPTRSEGAVFPPVTADEGKTQDESLVDTPAAHASGDVPRDQPPYEPPATTQPVDDGEHEGHRGHGLADRQPENGAEAAGEDNR